MNEMLSVGGCMFFRLAIFYLSKFNLLSISIPVCEFVEPNEIDESMRSSLYWYPQ